MSYDKSWNISSQRISIPVNGILDLVFEPDGEKERVVRRGRGCVTGQLDCAAQQAGQSHQVVGGGGGGEAEAAQGEAHHSQHQHRQHQPAGILTGTTGTLTLISQTLLGGLVGSARDR